MIRSGDDGPRVRLATAEEIRAITRRQALRGALGALAAGALGCQGSSDPDAAPPPRYAPQAPVPSPGSPQEPPSPYGTPPPRVDTPQSTPTSQCHETHDNIEGPYYRSGAPRRSNLVDRDVRGIPLIVRGRVTGPDCAAGLGGVLLDVWQANAEGHYDNDGTMRLPQGSFLLRGTFSTAADGSYELRTIVPGRYLNGRQYRPAHIHVKVAAPGHRPLTTQLYFQGDPYNDVDPFLHRSLIMPVEQAAGGKLARFDFALAPA